MAPVGYFRSCSRFSKVQAITFSRPLAICQTVPGCVCLLIRASVFVYCVRFLFRIPYLKRKDLEAGRMERGRETPPPPPPPEVWLISFSLARRWIKLICKCSRFATNRLDLQSASSRLASGWKMQLIWCRLLMCEVSSKINEWLQLMIISL